MPKPKAKTTTKGKKADSAKVLVMGTNDGFGKGLMKIAREYPDVVCLNADLTFSVRMGEFAERYPERFFQLGVAEQNMAGMAAGMALSGLIPFMGSFASFQPYRNLDQIRTSICMMNANVKIVSSHAGLSYAADGIQIQALEDVGIMRMLPNMTVLVPADAEQAEVMTAWAAEINGPVYLRLGREKIPVLHRSKVGLTLGRAQILREGTDITLIANGYMVAKALQAAELLAADGVSAEVLNLHTMKPFDRESVNLSATKTGRVLTIEEHQITGGLGSAVAESLVLSGLNVRMQMLGVNDRFGQTARTTAELWDYYQLTAENTYALAKQLLS